MIYADHAATTALSPTAFEAMRPWLREQYGNPSTLYGFARAPRKAVASARERIAACIGAKPEEICFTSGGTEADNWALTGTVFGSANRRGHIITSEIEHHAILHTCAFLEKIGCDISFLPVDRHGIVAPDTLEAALRGDTLLVSVMLANNEIGTIEPIHELAAIAHRRGTLFHTDAVQAMGHIPIDVSESGVDMLCASAHKFNGPKGIGFLYLRSGISLEPLMHGGAQERGMRAGTENVAAIVGMAEALCEHQNALERDAAYLNNLAKLLVDTLRAEGADFIQNGGDTRVPGSLSLSFRGANGETLLHRLDLMGTAVATGSACDSKNNVLSHVIRAIGVPQAYARGTIRVTLGTDNTPDEMRIIAAQITRVLGRH